MATRHESDPAPPEPPEPPELRRRLRLGRIQLIGVPLLFVLPVLALLDVFGDRVGQATVRSAELELRVEWPTHTRHEQIGEITMVVRNASTRVLDTVTVAVDRGYLAAFSGRAVTPGASQAWEVELAGLHPGEARHVVVELDARYGGRHAGPVIATAGGADTARVMLDTFIFP